MDAIFVQRVAKFAEGLIDRRLSSREKNQLDEFVEENRKFIEDKKEIVQVAELASEFIKTIDSDVAIDLSGTKSYTQGNYDVVSFLGLDTFDKLISNFNPEAKKKKAYMCLDSKYARFNDECTKLTWNFNNTLIDSDNSTNVVGFVRDITSIRMQSIVVRKFPSIPQRATVLIEELSAQSFVMPSGRRFHFLGLLNDAFVIGNLAENDINAILGDEIPDGPTSITIPVVSNPDINGYGAKNQLIFVRPPIIVFEVNDFGRVLSKVLYSPGFVELIRYNYDSNGIMTSIDYDADTDVIFLDDGFGNTITSIIAYYLGDPPVPVVYNLDENGNVLSVDYNPPAAPPPLPVDDYYVVPNYSKYDKYEIVAGNRMNEGYYRFNKPITTLNTITVSIGNPDTLVVIPKYEFLSPRLIAVNNVLPTPYLDIDLQEPHYFTSTPNPINPDVNLEWYSVFIDGFSSGDPVVDREVNIREYTVVEVLSPTTIRVRLAVMRMGLRATFPESVFTLSSTPPLSSTIRAVRFNGFRVIMNFEIEYISA